MKTHPDKSRCFSTARPGLTLLELMVVMVILAIVATVAIQSIQPQVDNRRFQTASKLLADIDLAVGGPIQKYQSDGTPLISGYVADVGCFPGSTSSSLKDSLQAIPDLKALSSAQSNTLADLWRTDSELATQFPFQFRPGPSTPVDYSAIRLPCGWRGPYLKLPIGQNQLQDPWGRTPEVYVDEQNSLFSVRIQLPESVSIKDKLLSQDLTTCKVEVTGKLILPDPEKASVQVALLTPDPNSSLTTLKVMDDEDSGVGSFLFTNVPVGLRAVVADVNGVRYVKYVQVPRGGANLVFECHQAN